MIKNEIPVTVYERNDPLRRFKIYLVDNVGARTPYDLTGASAVEVFVKAGSATLDDDAAHKYVLTQGVSIIAPATGGTLDVQFKWADYSELGTGTFRYRVDVVKNNLRETVMAGPFVIRNT